MKYDIFLSYRRQEGSGRSNVPMARTLKLEFEKRGYKVFFDFSECTDNYFSQTILPAIWACDYFVLVLTADCLSRCVNERDWVRREIEEALASNKKIIPITPDNECSAWPNLPDSLNKLDGLQITTIYTDHMFENCVGFVIKNRFMKRRRTKQLRAVSKTVIKPKNYIVLSIAVTFLGFWPSGIPAILNAIKVNKLWKDGFYDEAENTSKKAKEWMVFAAVIGVCYYVIIIYHYYSTH